MVIQKLKVQYHNRELRGGFSDVLLSSRGNHGISVGDLIEVYHPEDVHHGLFLVTVLRDDVQTRDIISIESSLAQLFRLQQHKTVCVRVVDKECVTLDLVELHFREQYLSRSDCFRLSQELMGSVVQVNKKIEANDFRVQVGELWRCGEKYSCGYVNDQTKIVFRSSSASIHIFIQMSEEMWIFDDHGDLFFEKAVKFLSKLFLRFWPENNCNHDTNVVFFTRAYITGLPTVYHDRVNRDFSGRIYEDFYRVLVQNERFTLEEWKRVLTQLKLEFRTFQRDLYAYVREAYPIPDGSPLPKLRVSSAMEGNFLETINMALNFYAGYNVDRNFDRTGKLSYLLSPGTGCFLVDRQLAEMTKQRILDLGVGIDLICFGQQPLHAVPMFKLVNSSQPDAVEEFLVPHWINCSFFRSTHELRQVELGLPISRTRIFPTSKEEGVFCFSKSSIKEVPTAANIRPSGKFIRRRTKVLRIFYPPSNVTKPPKNNLLDLNNPCSCQPSPIFGSDGSQTNQTTTPTHTFGINSKRSVNPIITAINTASTVAKANRDSRLLSQGSESDGSPIQSTIKCDKENIAKFPSSLTRVECREGEMDRPDKNTGAQIIPVRKSQSGSLTSSLNTGRGRQLPVIASARQGNSPGDATRQRSDSMASERDETLSNASSSEDMVQHGVGRLHAQRPWGMQRPLSFGGSGRDQKLRIQTSSGSSSQNTTMTPATLTSTTTFGSTQKRFIPCSMQTSAQTVRARGVSRPIGRVRTNSMLYPTLHPQNPFEIKLDLVNHTRSIGQRCWEHVRPQNELGLPIPPHRDLFGLRTLEFLHPITQVVNLSQVWAAYFAFLRSKLKQSAPGGPVQVTSLGTTGMTNRFDPTGATIRPGPFEDGRMAMTVSKGHTLRPVIPWSTTDLGSFTTARKRSECLLTESTHSLHGTLKAADPSMLQLINSYTRRDLEPLILANEMAYADGGSNQGPSSEALQLLDAIRQAIRKPFDCDTPNFFTVDRSLSEQRLKTLKNTLKLIGVDWKSVSTPACLPIATDFFPDSASLKSDSFTLHDYGVVPYGFSPEEWESKHNFDKEPGLVYFRRPMTVREVFYEMVLQRLSHGFQLCQEPAASNHPTSSIPSDHSSSKLGSPGSTNTSLSPPGFAKLTGRPTPLRSSIWLTSGLEARKSSTHGSNSHVTRRSLGHPHPTGSTNTNPVLSTQNRPAARNRHTNNRTPLDTTVVNSANATATTSSGAGMINQRTGTSTTCVVNTVGLCRSLGVGLTLPQPTRTSGTGARSFTTKGRRSDSAVTVTKLSTPFEHFGQSSPTVVRLCMGRLFHSVSLVEDSITVTNYRFRSQDDERIQMAYKYTLRVPDADRFQQLKTLFSNEGTTMLNWSYLDNYLCTRGVSDSFVLLPSLKFWRTRFMVLPVYTNETKRLSDLIKERMSSGGPPVMCDVYEADYRTMDPVKICEKFTHFIESINRVRRSNPATRKPTRQLAMDKTEAIFRSRELSGSGTYAVQPGAIGTSVCGSATGVTTGGVNTTTTTTASTNSVVASSSGTKTVVGSNVVGVATSTTAHQRLMSGLANNSCQNTETQTRASPSVEEPSANPVSNSGTTTVLEASIQSTSTVPMTQLIGTPSLTSTSIPIYQVVSLMLDPDNGLPFILTTSTSVFPERTFFSFDAVAWAIRTFSDVDSVEQAVNYLQTLVNAGWISHTSGNPSHRFIFGCYFYTLLAPDLRSHGTPGHLTSAEVLYPNTSTEGTEWVVQSTPTNAGSSSTHGGGGALGPGPTTQASQSAVNLATMASASSSLSKLSDSGLASATSTTALTTPVATTCTGTNAGPQPIRFPESFLPRATPGPNGSIIDFQTEWVEIAFAPNALSDHCSYPVVTSQTKVQLTLEEPTESRPSRSYTSSGTDKCGTQEWTSVPGKSCICDLDDATVGDRAEWARFVYDANYHPLCAFTMELQWLVASGSRLSELVSQWHHRARNSLHFFPVPCFPFEHPGLRSDSDPLRHPVFVPCRFDRISTSNYRKTIPEDKPIKTGPNSPGADASEIANQLFCEFPEHNRLHMLRLFQDYLLRRFGFLPDAYDSCQVSSVAQLHDILEKPIPPKTWTYVHCSGGMFVMIPIYRSDAVSSLNVNHEKSSSTATLRVETPSESQHVSPMRPAHTRQLHQTWSKDTLVAETAAGYVNAAFKDRTEVGYFWAWNHMLLRRGYLTGDESFQDAMLFDFRAFMSAEDDRLSKSLTGFLDSLAKFNKTDSAPN